MHTPFVRLGLALGAVLALTPAASAITKTSTLNVSVSVVSNCAFTGGTLDFGTYTPGQTAEKTGQMQLNYTNCGPGTIKFELDGGGAGNTSARKLKSGANQLDYQLYTNTTRTTVWGTGTQGREVALTAVGNGNVIVYGKIPGSQSIPPGAYTDTIAVTLTF